jgi:hypothetical protein
MINQLSLQASQSSLVVTSALASAFTISRMVAFLKKCMPTCSVRRSNYCWYLINKV